jgi:AraC-like DNA-binding protein
MSSIARTSQRVGDRDRPSEGGQSRVSAKIRRPVCACMAAVLFKTAVVSAQTGSLRTDALDHHDESHGRDSRLPAQAPANGGGVRAAPLHRSGVSLADAAVFYDLDVRTLRRSLAHCGTSWREILKELRCRRAEELLENTAFKIDYVARLAGYSSTSAFVKVFRKRYSSTPSQYRRGKEGAGTRRRPHRRVRSPAPPLDLAGR